METPVEMNIKSVDTSANGFMNLIVAMFAKNNNKLSTPIKIAIFLFLVTSNTFTPPKITQTSSFLSLDKLDNESAPH